MLWTADGHPVSQQVENQNFETGICFAFPSGKRLATLTIGIDLREILSLNYMKSFLDCLSFFEV